MTLLFTMAQCNGTLDRLAHHAVRICRGHRGVVPIMYFVLAAGLASIGPGNISTAALVAPMAMTTAMKANIPLFLMAIMVGNGANAGSLSPFAPTGIIVNGLMARIGMTGLQMETYVSNLLAHALVAFGGYFLFGGWKLFTEHSAATVAPESADAADGAFETRHWLTMAVIATLITSVIFLRGECRHGRVRGRDRAGAVERRRRPRSDQADAVERHRDGQRRDGADRAARESTGHRPDRVDDRQVVDPRFGDRRSSRS